jgi:hypothetical protein
MMGRFEAEVIGGDESRSSLEIARAVAVKKMMWAGHALISGHSADRSTKHTKDTEFRGKTGRTSDRSRVPGLNHSDETNRGSHRLTRITVAQAIRVSSAALTR